MGCIVHCQRKSTYEYAIVVVVLLIKQLMEIIVIFITFVYKIYYKNHTSRDCVELPEYTALPEQNTSTIFFSADWVQQEFLTFYASHNGPFVQLYKHSSPYTGL